MSLFNSAMVLLAIGCFFVVVYLLAEMHDKRQRRQEAELKAAWEAKAANERKRLADEEEARRREAEARRAEAEETQRIERMLTDDAKLLTTRAEMCARIVAMSVDPRRDGPDVVMAVMFGNGDIPARFRDRVARTLSLINDLFDACSSSDADASRALMDGLEDHEWALQYAAALWAGERKLIGALGPLQDLLRHDNGYVRKAAARGLAALGDASAVHQLREAWRAETTDGTKDAIGKAIDTLLGRQRID